MASEAFNNLKQLTDDPVKSPLDTGVTPSNAASILELRAKTGLPRAAIESDIVGVQAESARRDFDATEYRRNSPKLASWTDEQPDNFSLVKGNLDTYRNIEALVDTMVLGYQGHWDEAGEAIRRNSFFDAMFSGASAGTTISEEGRAWADVAEGTRSMDNEYLTTLEERGEDARRTGSGISARFVHPAAEIAGQIYSSGIHALKYGIAGAMAGTFVPGAGTAVGFTAGLGGGFAGDVMRIEMGHAYKEYQHIEGISDAQRKWGAYSVGMVNAVLETSGVTMVSKPYATLIRKHLRKGVSDAFRKRTVASAAGQAAKGYGLALGGEVGTEMAQETSNLLVQELLRMSSDKDMATWTDENWAAAGEQIMEIASKVARGMMVLPIPGAVGNLTTDIRSIRRAEQAAEFYRAAGMGLDKSEAHKVMPQSSIDILKKMTESGPLEGTWIDISAWDSYWQEKGDDPRARWVELNGDAAEYDQAGPDGTARMETATAVARMAETGHTEFLADEGRMGSPEEHNGREVTAWREEMAEYKSVEGSSSAKVFDDVVGQLISTGMNQQTAESYAQVYEATFGALGERTGIDAMELYEKYGLRVQSPIADILKQGREINDLDPIIDRFRAGETPTDRQVYGESLFEFVIRKGGLMLGEGGELEAFDFDKIRTDKGRKLTGTRDIGDLTELAAEAGFIEDNDENLMLDALREESMGDPVYTLQGLDTVQQGERQVFDNLSEYLDASRIDINTATNKEIKALLRDSETYYQAVGKNAITGNLELVNEAASTSAKSALERIPVTERIRLMRLMEQHKGTSWAAATVKGLVYRDMLYRALAGEDISHLEVNEVWGKQDMGKTKIIKAFKKGKPAIQKLIAAYDFIGSNRKAEQDLSTSFANCNPSVACAKHCYAALSNARPNEIAKAEFTEMVLEMFPEMVAENVAEDYSISVPGKADLVLRLNDKGDLSRAQLKLVKALNDRGIGLQIFTKRPDLAKDIDSDLNLVMLSIDDTNVELARQHPDMRIAYTTTDGTTEALLAEFADRLAVILPVNLRGKEYSRDEFKAQFPNVWKDVKDALCPVDGGRMITIPGSSFVDIIDGNAPNKAWTCTSCDKLGAAGCFHGGTAAAIRANHRKAAGLVDPDARGEESADVVRKQMLAQLDALKKLGGVTDEQYAAIHESLDAGVDVIWAEADQRQAQPVNDPDPQESGTEDGSGEGTGGNAKRLAGQTYFQPAWHGGPHQFDKFSMSAIGTGEGVQAYGYGLYFAESETVAGSYKTMKARPEVVREDFMQIADGNGLHYLVAQDAANTFMQNGNDADGVIRMLREKADDFAKEGDVSAERLYRSGEQSLSGVRDDISKITINQGHLYEVDIPDSAIDKMLDWDGGLDDAQRKLLNLPNEADAKAILERGDKMVKELNGITDDAAYAKRNKEVEKFLLSDEYLNAEVSAEYSGRMFYRWIGEKHGGMESSQLDKKASEFLNAAGIPGIKYFDGDSRFAGEGTSNFVIFDEDIITIKTRNGEPVADQSVAKKELAQEQKPQEESKEFKLWFDESKIVDLDGKPLMVYHGTLGDYDSFNPSMTNPEADLGAGFYFSSSPADVGNNYAGYGPDITNKLDYESERIADQDELSETDARDAAKEKLRITHAGATMPIYLSIQNPAVLGGEGETFLDYNENYDEENETSEESGTLVDFLEALAEAEMYFDDGTTDQVLDKIMMEAMDNGGISLSDVVSMLKDSEEFGYYTDPETGNLVSSEIIRRAIEGMGFDGIIDNTVNDKFGVDREFGVGMPGIDEDTTHYIAFKPEQIKSAIGNQGTFKRQSSNILYQQAETAKRGAMTVTPEGSHIISLFEDRDLSTFLHETGHFYLEVLGDLAGNAGKGTSIEADYQTLLKWFGVKSRDEITVAHHEKFARGFELYLREGKAPTEELRSAFASFTAWLTSIYRKVADLDVKLNKDVRAVMDRMLATDDAIAAEKNKSSQISIFTDAESANMTNEQFAAYQKVLKEAHEEARNDVHQKFMREMEREQKKWWSDERKKMREEVEAEVNEQPDQIAWSVLTSGTLPDGTDVDPVKVSRQDIIDENGKSFLKRIPKGKQAIYSKDGSSLHVVAIMFGFKSGDEFLLAMANLRKRKDLIEAETDERMKRLFGDKLTDGTLAADAEAALQGKGREKVIEAELKALRRAARAAQPAVRAERQKWEAGMRQVRDSTIPIAAMREMALGRVQQMRVGQLRPNQHLQLIRKYAREAARAAANGDFQLAATHKQNERMSLEMYKATLAAQKKSSKYLGFMRKFMTKTVRTRLAKTGHLEQIDALLDRFEFKAMSQLKLLKRESLRSYLDRMEADGIVVDMPDEVLDEANRKNWKELTVDELEAIRDGAAQIEQFSRLKNKLYKLQQERTMQQIEDSVLESLDKNAVAFIGRDIVGEDWGARKLKSIAQVMAGGRKLASIIRQLDGLKDGGVLWNLIVRPINEAADTEANMHREAADALDKIFAGHTATMSDPRRMTKKRQIAGVPRRGRPDGSWSLDEILSVALNVGNLDSRAKLMAGYKWNEAQLETVLGELTDADWNFVQDTWDYVNSYWPDMKAKEERLFGVAPQKVEAQSFTTPSGREMEGGYYPLKYDSDLSERAEGFSSKDAGDIMRKGGSVRKQTKRSHAKARVENVKMPIRLSLNVLYEHVGEVIHDLSFHETLVDVHRVLGRRKIKAALHHTAGKAVYRTILDILDVTAAGKDAPLEGLAPLVDHIRKGTSVAMMGMSVSTMAIQFSGFNQSLLRLGPKYMFKGLVNTYNLDVVKTTRMVHEKSQAMKDRATTMNREINEIRNKVEGGGGALGPYTMGTGIMFAGIAKVQMAVDIPTWVGAYEKAIDSGQSEATSIAIADQTVKDTQSSGLLNDLAKWQTGTAWQKLFTNFYSYFSATYNLTAESIAEFRGKEGEARWMKLVTDMFVLYTIPVMMEEAIRGVILGQEPDDPDEAWYWRFAKSQLSYVLGIMPVIRELGGMVKGYRYSGPAGARVLADVGKAAQQVGQGEIDKALVKAVISVGGPIFHYPSAQINRTVDGLYYLAETGETNYGRYLLMGGPRE